jgi:DNA invertase Pin-like site-specific DNA recombinase
MERPMPRTFAYVRVSTTEQTTENQIWEFRPDTTDEMFARWDVDGSGELDQEELMSAVREIFAKSAETYDR